MVVRTGIGRGDQAKGRKIVPWQEAVNLFIVSGGLLGKTQTELIIRFKSAIDTDTLKEYLDVLWLEGKVDRFQVTHHTGKGKPAVVWRATTKIGEP